MSLEENIEENIQLINKYDTIFGVFKILDYDLNLEERRAKYKKYDHIICEKCNNYIYKQYYYCTVCYNKETDAIKKNHMKLGSDSKIFNTFDYNLNLEERKAKYEKYNFVVCENCNKEINNPYYFCAYCYDKETDTIKKNHMKFGSDFKFFNFFDYNLNSEERKAKYEKYDLVVCEKLCFIGNNDDCCSFYEFKKFLENLSEWINENNVFKTSKIGISDYDLDEEDRREKYKNFDYILCEKCNRKYHYNYCYECFDEKIRELKELSPKLQDYENFYLKVYKKETKELRELKELQSILIDYKNIYFELNSNLGIFKQIRKKFENTKYYVLDKKILINNIRYNGVHNCWRKLRSYCCDCYDGEIDIIEKKRQVNTFHSDKCSDCIIMDID
ncbi:14581_t:CDS:2 [Rhizophagus irregularis]|nr:14581_t:CDS:2 [Rhizophagus irregularis]